MADAAMSDGFLIEGNKNCAGCKLCPVRRCSVVQVVIQKLLQDLVLEGFLSESCFSYFIKSVASSVT